MIRVSIKASVLGDAPTLLYMAVPVSSSRYSTVTAEAGRKYCTWLKP